MARLVELSALERTVKGPERVLREEDVAVLVRSAYDDATDAARAEFMQRIQRMPTSAWPWSAVQALTPRSANTLGSLVAIPLPSLTPPALILIRGQVESADVDLANRLPDRGTAAALEWEPLYKALDAWDTQTILKAIGPQGWVSIVGSMSGQVSQDNGTGTTSGTTNPPKGMTNGSTSGAPSGSTNGPSGGGKVPSGQTDFPAPQEPASALALSWKHPAVIAAGAAVVVMVGGVVVHNLGRGRKSRLEEALGRQEEGS
ncbi:hypothetical protein [Nannocystis pusilla]|uniref:hypothetical protein n=1 Tax=Nannocystis pusilla TaxID=889268 RepID=UPI003B78E6B7